jgi:hypothetical protein
MSKERYNQIIDEAYENYLKNWKPQPVVEDEYYWLENELVSDRPLPKDMFIHCIKKDTEFSEKWGLKIEERELSLEERYNLIEDDKHTQFVNWQSLGTDRVKESLDEQNISTKLITLTYNNETIESYE